MDTLMTKGLKDESIELILTLLKLGDEYCIEGLIRYAEAKFSELLSRHMYPEYLDELPGSYCTLYTLAIKHFHKPCTTYKGIQSY